MKSGTTELMKFKRLQRRLKESTRGTVGLLEMIWMNACRSCVRGDIGRFSNEEIAIMGGYEGDPDELVDALVDSGWLDTHSDYRLVIHDWDQHAPNFVKGNVVQHHGGFANLSPGTVPRDTPRDTPKDSPRGPSQNPIPIKSIQAKPSQAKSSQVKSGGIQGGKTPLFEDSDDRPDVVTSLPNESQGTAGERSEANLSGESHNDESASNAKPEALKSKAPKQPKSNQISTTGEWVIPSHLDTPLIRELLGEFEAMRRDIRKPIVDRKRASSVLQLFDGGVEHLEHALRTCIANQYQGLKPDYRPTVPRVNGTSGIRNDRSDPRGNIAIANKLMSQSQENDYEAIDQ